MRSTAPGTKPRSVRAEESDAAAASSVSPVNEAELAIVPPPHFWPTSQLALPPLPRSEPDATRLMGAVASGLPIRLRLYIDALGAVASIEVLQASERDADVVDRMKNMFYDTRFLAGKRAGIDVASYMDIEVSVADLT